MKRSKAKKVLLSLLVLTAALAGGAVLARLVIMPLAAEHRVRAILSDIWAGEISFDADLDFSGNIDVRNLRLDDAQRRTWLHVPRATLGTKGWTRFSPTLKSITAGILECNLYLGHGRCGPPVKAPPAKSLGGRTVRDAESLLAGNLIVRVVRSDADCEIVEYPSLSLDLRHGPGQVRLLVRQTVADADEYLRLDAAWDTAAGTIDAEIGLRRRISPGDVAVAADLLAPKNLASAAGELALSGSMRGHLDRPAELRHDFDMELRNGRVELTDGTVVENIALAARAINGQGVLRDGHVTVDMVDLILRETPFSYELGKLALAARDIDATVTMSQREPRGWLLKHWIGRVSGEGRIHARGTVEYDAGRNEPLSAQLQLRAENLAAAYRTAPPNRPLCLESILWKEASLTASTIAIKGLSIQTLGGRIEGDLTAGDYLSDRGRTEISLTGKGIQLDEVRRSLAADVKTMPAGGRLAFQAQLAGPQQYPLDYSGYGQFAIDDADFWPMPLLSVTFDLMKVPHNPAAISDAECEFELKDGVAAIGHAVVANALAGVELTGGTVNIRDGAVDVYVVGGNFLTMNALARPLLKDIKTLLFARRVRGKWDKLTSADFIPIPGANIPEASVTLAHKLAQTGGDLGADIGSIFHKLLNNGQGKK